MEPAPTRNITDSASLTIWGSWSPYDAIWAANDAQRERQKCADEVKNVVENVLIDHETITKTKAFVVAMSNSLVATRVPFDADDHQYAKKAELLQASFDCTYGNEEGQRWIQVMGPYASSANSFYIRTYAKY